MTKGLRIAEPPVRRTAEQGHAGSSSSAFNQVPDIEKVQFNRRVPRAVADGYEMLAIVTRHKVPDLLAEGLELLQEKHGRP